jgi:DNA-binding LytR/AlgR family response regulator
MNTIQIPASYYSYNHNLPFTWQDVVRLEGQSNYTVFVLKDGQKHVSTKSIGNYEAFLPSHFLRIHKGCIVNQSAIVQIQKATKIVYLSDGFWVEVARRRWKLLLIKVEAIN